MEIYLDSSKYDVKINTKEIIKNFFDFSWGTLITDIVSVSDSKETKAFWLLFKSIRETNFQLSKEYGQDEINSASNQENIAADISGDLRIFLKQKVFITKEFFSDALKHNNDYIIFAFKLFEKYCSILRIGLPDNIRLKYYYLLRQNLSQEFQSNKPSYEDLIQYFDNPIFEQNEDFSSMFEYYSFIKKNYTDKLQKDGESQETLKDLYIDPYFKIFKNNITTKILEKKNRARDDFYNPESTLTLHNFINNYFFKNKQLDDLKENYDMIFLLGQPGQGKTSCCYKLAYDYLEENNDLPQEKIFFVKIRELVAEDFVTNPFQEISKKIPNFIDLNKEKGFLILDGLDEAYMSGGINENDLRNLYERLKKRPNKNLKIILTSRYSYLQVADSCLDNTLIINLSNLTDEQILLYSKKFEIFYPNSNFNKEIDKIIAESRYIHIKELLQQAVLIYFIGISNINIEEKDSKAKIYDKIFDAMAYRSWDKSGQLDYLNSRMKDNPENYKKHLRDYLCNLAFEIYQSPKLYISLAHLNSLDATKNFAKKCFREDLLESVENIKEINKYLLISFYFQESNKNDNNDTAIEFFHNSLYEYLTAEFFWRENKKLLLKTDEDGDFINIKYDEYFNLLDKLIGSKEIYGAVSSALVEIIENEKFDVKQNIVNQSSKLFKTAVDNDFLLTYNRKLCKLTSKEKTKQLFRLFWIFLHTSNLEMPTQFELPKNISFYMSDNFSIFEDWINMVTYNEDLLEKVRMHEGVMSNMSFVNCYLSIDLYECLIKDTNFLDVSFTDIDISNCVFENVIFDDSDFNGYKNTINKNKFINCQFDNVEIEDEKWFKTFIKLNKCDEEILKKHSVESRLEKDYNQKDITKFYIVMNKQ